jgi:hypothetical protein
MREKAITGKQEMRKRLAVLSFSEKINMLEKLRDRSLAIAAGGLRRQSGNASQRAVDTGSKG